MNDGPLWLLALPAAGLGFLAGRIRMDSARWAAVLAVMALPFLAWAILYRLADPGEGGLVGWWFFGLLVYGAPLAGWILLATLGYLFGRSKRRDLR